MIIEVSNMRRYSGKVNKLRYIYTIRGTFGDIAIKEREINNTKTRFDVYKTLCPQQMLVHKGGQIKNWSGECKDIIPTKLECQTIQRTL